MSTGGEGGRLTWPPDAADLERLFLKERLSYKQIAALYGVTRNVVAGRCQRAGLRSGDGVGGRVPIEVRQEPRGCRWVHGDPRHRRRWAFCQQAQREGSDYCDQHHRRVYIPRPRGRAPSAEEAFF